MLLYASSCPIKTEDIRTMMKHSTILTPFGEATGGSEMISGVNAYRVNGTVLWKLSNAQNAKIHEAYRKGDGTA